MQPKKWYVVEVRYTEPSDFSIYETRIHIKAGDPREAEIRAGWDIEERHEYVVSVVCSDAIDEYTEEEWVKKVEAGCKEGEVE